MYRNCQFKQCCSCNQKTCKEDVLEDLCSDVPNTISCDDLCDCGFDEEDNLFPRNPMFGQSYVPWQTMGKTFTPEAGLRMGTIYPELVDPYVPCQSIEENAFIEANNKIGEGCNKC